MKKQYLSYIKINMISLIIAIIILPLYILTKYVNDDLPLKKDNVTLKVILKKNNNIFIKSHLIKNNNFHEANMLDVNVFNISDSKEFNEDSYYFWKIALVNTPEIQAEDLKFQLKVKNKIYEKTITKDFIIENKKIGDHYTLLFSYDDIDPDIKVKFTIPRIIRKLTRIPIPLNYGSDFYLFSYSLLSLFIIFIFILTFIISLNTIVKNLVRESNSIISFLMLLILILNIMPLYTLLSKNMNYKGSTLFINYLYLLHYLFLFSIRLLQDLSITIIIIKSIENLKFMFLRIPLGFALGSYIFLLIANSVVLLMTKEDVNYTLFSIFEFRGALNFVHPIVLISSLIFTSIIILLAIKLIKYKYNLMPLIAASLILILTNISFNSLVLISNFSNKFYKKIFIKSKKIFRNTYDLNHYEQIFFDTKEEEFSRNKGFFRSIVFSLLEEYKLNNLNFKENKTLDKFKDNLNQIQGEYSLNFGKKRKYPKITNKKYNKILLFFLESNNLEYIKTYNENLQAQNSNYFFSSPKIMENTFTNYYSATRPTIYGITLSLTSQTAPNIYEYLLFKKGEKIETALPFILQKKGFTTYYMGLTDITYSYKDVYFRQLGFNYTYGVQHFAKNDIEVANFLKNSERSQWIHAVPDILLYKKIYEFIKEKKDEKYFLTSLNIDTHVPGRREKDYYGLDKDIPDFKISNKYNEYGKYILRGVGIIDFLLAELLEKLESEGLFTDDMLIIISADHSTPPLLLNLNYDEFDTKSDLNKIPLIFLSKSNEFAQFNKEVLGSQIDFASTLLHILDIEVPQVYFGDSLFTDKKDLAILREFNGNFILKYKSGKELMLHRNSNSLLKELLSSIFLN